MRTAKSLCGTGFRLTAPKGHFDLLGASRGAGHPLADHTDGAPCPRSTGQVTLPATR
jgi:hypothetical protein